MYVGVDLDATARAKGPRMKDVKARPTNFLGSGSFDPLQSSSGVSVRRSHSFTPPSSRLTQPTKSQQRRNDLTAPSSGSTTARGRPKSARSSSGGTPAPGTPGTPGTPASAGGVAPPRDPAGHASARLAPAGGSPGFFGTPGSSSRRSRQSNYTARVSSHTQTHSPSGRFHPDATRRREIRQCDITANIDYYAPHGAPDNDRKMKEASWLTSQAFIESLRVYPDPGGPKSPIQLPGEEIAFSGNTNSSRRLHREHVETALRRRLSIAPADTDWLPDQLPKEWPDRIPEGVWRPVGNGLALLGSGAGGTGLFGKLFKGGKVGSPASRAAAAAVAAATASQAGSELASSRGLPSHRSGEPSARGSALGGPPKQEMLFDRT